MRPPFFRFYMCNDPAIVDLVPKQWPTDFPISDRIRVGLKPLLGESVFITNGALWARQRRTVDPAFEGGCVRHIFPAMWDCGVAAVERLKPLANGQPVEIETQTSHLAMEPDKIYFSALFKLAHSKAVFRGIMRLYPPVPMYVRKAYIPFYGWVLMPLLDIFLGKNLRNPDPYTPDAALVWFRLLTWLWFSIQFALVFGALYCVTRRQLFHAGNAGHYVWHWGDNRHSRHRLFA